MVDAILDLRLKGLAPDKIAAQFGISHMIVKPFVEFLRDVNFKGTIIHNGQNK
jgi:hypothetical protein